MCGLLSVGANAQVAKTYEVGAEPSTGVASDVAVDIIAHGDMPKGVWLVTGRGINYTFDEGQSWYVHNVASGLPAENLSAAFSIGGRLWVAANHNELVSSELQSLSDGLTYSDDNGASWHQINFGSDGLDISFVWGGDRNIYDITGHTDEGFFSHRTNNRDVNWLFFTAFAGGLLASQDGGMNWRRIYAESDDSLSTSEEPPVRARYFSCAADTSHGDTLFLWAGTAEGVVQFLFVPPREKLYLQQVNCIAFGDSSLTGDTGTVFIGGEIGLARTSTAGGKIVTRFENDGLPAPEVTAVTSVGDNLLVGVADTVTGAAGLALSVDRGETFTPLVLPIEFTSAGRVSAFGCWRDSLFMAGGEAGFFVSPSDLSDDWSHLYVDTVDSNAATNHVNAIDVIGDTILLGTDSGLVELYMAADGAIDSVIHTPFAERDSSSAKIIKVRTQVITSLVDSVVVVDSTIVWTVHRPMTDDGEPMVGRRGYIIDTLTLDPLTTDTVENWTHLQVPAITYDVNFFDDTAFVVGTNGIRYTTRGTNPANSFAVHDTSGNDLFEDDTVTVMEIKGDTVIFGSLNGLAFSTDRGRYFRAYRPNLDTLAWDRRIRHTYLNSIFRLYGDFIPAMDVQYLPSGPARIWVSTRPAEVGQTGISVGEYDTTSGQFVWQPVLDDTLSPGITWNFAFVGDSVFAANDNGLLLHTGERDVDDKFVTTWDTVPLIDFVSSEVLVDPDVGVYGVAAIDSFLWVGTDDGTVKISLDDPDAKELYQRVDSAAAADEVYAFPVPFAPHRHREVNFHFVVEQPGYVTLEIYDFAMNPVARPIDNEYYEAGIYPSGSSQGVSWDGYNGNGDQVAVGVYYFKVEVSSGETRWGKLAVIP